MFRKNVFFQELSLFCQLGLLLVVQIMVEETVHLNNVENFEDLLQLMNIGEGCCCMQRIGKPQFSCKACSIFLFPYYSFNYFLLLFIVKILDLFVYLTNAK